MRQLLDKKMWIGLLMIVPTLGLAQPQGGPPPAPVQVAVASNTQIAPIREIPGFTKARYITTIKAESSGRIVDLADIGSQHEVSAALGLIADNEYALRIEELQNAINNAQASVDFLRQESERLQTLYQRKLASSTDIDKNDSDLKIARGDLAQARARYQQLQDEITKLTVSAPFTGFVSAHHSQPGQWVNEGQDLLEYMSSGELEIVVNVPLQYKSQVQVGAQWQLRDQAGTLYQAEITGFVPAATSNSRQIRVQLATQDGGLFAGEAITVLMPEAAPQELLVIPRDALVLRRQGAHIFVINDAVARRVAVTTGLAQGDLIAVSGDLQAGDQVVTRGNERLRNQQTVQILNEK
ncbi:efflux RND transporter periplasmic adaptor subunit [Marinicella sp. W31]|uniref:efflux RND transporter periplasmic adaptor subunit n=1 Tax=Marinicella sp. W31 TaxID=3023713 RepID=UPI0037575E26